MINGKYDKQYYECAHLLKGINILIDNLLLTPLR